MKAVVINKFGPAEVLKSAEVCKPVPGHDQVLIKVKATSINPVDAKVRAGTHISCKNTKFPAILGWDVSGVVVACGKDVISLKDGDEVFGVAGFPGLGQTYAEYTVANPAQLVSKPQGVSFEEAAALPIAGLTAWQAIHDQLKVQAGQQILIQAAAGGVGHISLQLAKITGAKVFATASTENASFIQSLGADTFIDYQKDDFSDIVPVLDAVQEAIGGEVLYRSIRCLKPGGRIVCLPSSTKNDSEAIRLSKEQKAELIWPMMYQSREQLTALAQLIEAGKLKVHVSKVFSLEELPDAHLQIESHHTVGKVVVKI